MRDPLLGGVSQSRRHVGDDVDGRLRIELLSNPDAYQRSLKKMLALNADILCEGHYGVFKGKEAVRTFVASFVA